MNILLLTLGIALSILVIFPYNKFSQRISITEHKFIANTFQKIFTKGNRAVLAYWVCRVLLAIIVLSIFLFFAFRSEKPTQESTTQPVAIGFGAESSSVANSSPTLTQIEEDAAKIVPGPADSPIESLSSANQNKKIQFSENPRRYVYLTDNTQRYLELFINGSIAEFVLKSSDGKFEEIGVAKGLWDSTETYFIFTKAEILENAIPNKNNIWVYKYGETAANQIFSTQDLNNVSYVSNGSQIAFATKNQIGTMNMDGSNLQYVYTFAEFENRSDEMYVPEITLITSNTFSVNIKLPTYFVDRAEQNLQFDFVD